VGKDKVNMTLDYKGSRQFYTINGMGPVCVLLHGFIENHTIWDDLVIHLGTTRKVLSVDLPGHGQSDVLNEPTSMRSMADAVFAVLEKENIEKVDIIGHSMGGYVGLAFANVFPEKTSGLLLLNSTPVEDTPDRIATREHGIKIAKKNYESIVKMSVANMFAEESHEKLQKDIENLKAEALKTPLQGYINAQEAMMNRGDLSEFWKKASFKKGMILGREDPIIDAEKTKNAFKDKIPQISILKGGHALLLENPQKTYVEIQDFLNK